jgi:hypothetical protein
MIRFTEPCSQCEETGEVSCKCRGEFHVCALPFSGPCPSCVGGTVPDDATVEAAAAGFVASLVSLRVGISNALIAAARHQQEGQ